MLSLRLLLSVENLFSDSHPFNLLQSFHKLSPTLFCDSKHKDNKVEEEVEDKPKPKRNEEAIRKLNLLLKSMAEEEHLAPSTGIDAKLARPPVKKKEHVKKQETLVAAAKEVAETFGGDVKQTESELLNKLLASETVTKDETSAKKIPMNLRDLLSGMKIDRSERRGAVSEEGRAKQVRRIIEGQKQFITKEEMPYEVIRDQGPRMYDSKVDLFGGEPLGIFKIPESEEPKDVELKTWNRLNARELRLAVTHPASNYFEEMIQWTEQGKLWRFPINNEQGIEEEEKVYFTEHVFLEHLLEPWCPKKGPVRHFMELVCIGLSKNPHLTVKMKHEHIDWFHNYFEGKKQILLETGSLPGVLASEIKTEETTT